MFYTIYHRVSKLTKFGFNFWQCIRYRSSLQKKYKVFCEIRFLRPSLLRLRYFVTWRRAVRWIGVDVLEKCATVISLYPEYLDMQISPISFCLSTGLYDITLHNTVMMKEQCCEPFVWNYKQSFKKWNLHSIDTATDVPSLTLIRAL